MTKKPEIIFRPKEQGPLRIQESDPLLARIQSHIGGGLEVVLTTGDIIVTEGVWLYDQDGRVIQTLSGEIRHPLVFQQPAEHPKSSLHEKPGRFFKQKRIF